MSEITLGVLRMPPDLWTNDPMDVAQRHSRYVDAANEIDRLTAEVEKVERNAEYHADKNDELVAEVERLREQSHKVVAAWFGEEDNDASLDGLIYELNEISQRSD